MLPFSINSSGNGIKTIGCGVNTTNNSKGCLKLGTVEYTIAKHNIPIRICCYHASVVSIGDINSAKYFLLGVRDIISIGITHKP